VSAHRHRSTWRNITFNRRYLDVGLAPDDPANLDPNYVNSDYYLDLLDIVRVSAQDYREIRQYLEGSEPNEAFEGLRAITGHGRISAASPADLEDKTWAMYEAFSVAACRVAAATMDPKGVLPYDFKRDSAGGALPLRFWCRPGSGRPVVVGRAREGLVRPFIFQLLAMDPFAYDVTQTSVALGDIAGGNNVIAVPGNMYTKPKITIAFSAAGAASVTLTNVTTGQSLGLNLSTFVNTNSLVIDVARSSIVNQAGANKYSVRLSGFLSSLVLLPGNNTITWSSATGISSVTFAFRGAYA
jgi:hypothetical protein